ncbi:MAG: M56 family metallopeptidase [Bacillota bacterium]|nr:M56 family metallopeptidase [Bacillota bacterium]MDW7683361.1 M56 family metallopeptidase [Bacillota bacterium]
MQLYLLALITPFVGFILYHSVLTKRCQSGIIAEGAGWQFFNGLCRLGSSIIAYLGPLLAVMLVIGLLKGAAGTLLVARIRRAGAVPDLHQQERVEKIIRQCSSEHHLYMPEIVYSQRDSFIAFATGISRPVIVVSIPMLAHLSDHELTGILIHELIHIRRGDTRTGWLVHLARDAMFFSPFSTLLLDRYLLERERLCDSETVQSLGSSRLYAATLLKAWRLLLDRSDFKAGVVVGFTGKKRDLELRITSLLTGQEETKAMSGPLFNTLLLSLFAGTILYLGFIC